MTIRWYRLAVFALWLAATSWLMIRKILPPFFRGEPPAYELVVGDKPRPPVAWYLYLMTPLRLGLERNQPTVYRYYRNPQPCPF